MTRIERIQKFKACKKSVPFSRNVQINDVTLVVLHDEEARFKPCGAVRKGCDRWRR